MSQQVHISTGIWDSINKEIEPLVPIIPSWPPIVFALYGREDNHLQIVGYRRIETVKTRGGDDYHYPGIKKQGFHRKQEEGEWFSGTLVVGDTLDIDPGDERGSDKSWMIREQLDFRMKMERQSPNGPRKYHVYILDVYESTLAFD